MQNNIKSGDMVYDMKGTGKIALKVRKVVDGNVYFENNVFPYAIKDFVK